MEIIVTNFVRSTPVTVIKLIGELDASCFKDVIAAGQKCFETGTRNLLVDLSETGFMSSSGLVALHSISLIMRGEKSPDLEEGWSTIHAAGDSAESAVMYERHFKLVNPSPRVRMTLEKTGFDHSYEIFSSLEDALTAFD